MNDEALLREEAATLTRMLNFQGTIGMFGHVSVRVPGTDKCFISPGASTDKTVVRPEHMFVYNIDGTIIEHPGGLIPLEWRTGTPCSKIYPWGNGSPLKYAAEVKNVVEDFAAVQ